MRPHDAEWCSPDAYTCSERLGENPHGSEDTIAQKYNGQGPPRLVLFSPIAHEDLKDRSLPDGTGSVVREEASETTGG